MRKVTLPVLDPLMQIYKMCVSFFSFFVSEALYIISKRSSCRVATTFLVQKVMHLHLSRIKER